MTESKAQYARFPKALLGLSLVLGSAVIAPAQAQDSRLLEGERLINDPNYLRSLSMERMAAENRSEILARRPVPRQVIARVADRSGNYVEWEAPDLEGDEPSILINLNAADPGDFDPDFIAEQSPLKAYLALAPLNEPIPDKLLELSSQNDREFAANFNARVELRERYEKAAAAVKEKARALRVSEDYPSANSMCPSSFVNWVKSAYGEGYGDTKTCGQFSGFTQQNWSTYYGEIAPWNDHEYEVAYQGQCSPAAQSCSTFEGRLLVHRLRGNAGNGYDAAYNMQGHRYRFAVANCPGSNREMVMWRKRGSSAWIETPIAPNHMQIRVGGMSDPRPGAYPTLGVAYGLWKQVIPMSGSTYQMNRLSVSSNPGQYAYVCGDVMRRFETYDITPNSCNYGLDFAQDGPFDGACWE